MKFCSTCDNMYYISISDTNADKLEYYCRNCGNKDNADDIPGTMSVSNIQFTSDTTNMSNIINKYTKLDPTLPRIDHIPCPNSECATNREDGKKNREIIYIRYDETNIKYVYLCTECDFTWKTNDK
jgi:DNA-directed RNA polymerase subunit M/transcription elongation factor TFIIS|uniref:DNA-directed RNA polymerase M/15kDa subunit domain-containing protein n=1 Tax=viral metagenome TaxID=1070528 RepID=A0A6C0ILJ2_9ZZZZ